MPIAPYLTKAELARHFQLPESTIRFYCARFADFLPAQGEGRATRYAEACLDVLSFIKNTFPQARTSAAMENMLAQRFTRQTRKCSDHKKPSSRAADCPTPTIPDRFSRCPLPAQEISLAEQVLALSESLKMVCRDTEALREEVQRLRILLDTSEKTHQADLDQLRTLLNRLARDNAAKIAG